MKYTTEIIPREEIAFKGVFINREIICVTNSKKTRFSTYNRYDGSLVWNLTYDKNEYSVTGDLLVINHYNRISAYSLITGKEEWSFKNGEMTFSMKPVILKDKIMVMGRGDSIIHLNLDGNLLEEHKIKGDPVYQAYYVDDELVIYSIDNTFNSEFVLHCINYKNGEVLWTKEYGKENIFNFFSILNFICISPGRYDNSSREEKWQIIEVETGKMVNEFLFSNYWSLNLFGVRNFGLVAYNGENITFWEMNDMNTSKWIIKSPGPYNLESACLNNSHYLFLLYSDPQMIQVVDINEGKKTGEYKLVESPGVLLMAYDNFVYYSTSNGKILSVKL